MKEYVLELSDNDFEKLELELENPSEPNEALRKAFKEHEAKFTDLGAGPFYNQPTPINHAMNRIEFLLENYKDIQTEGCCSGRDCGCLGMSTNREYYEEQALHGIKHLLNDLIDLADKANLIIADTVKNKGFINDDKWKWFEAFNKLKGIK